MELWWPWGLPILGFLVVTGAVRTTWRRKYGRGAKRTLFRRVGAVCSVPIALGSLLITSLLIGCEEHGPLIGSPDRRHVARILVSDALGSVVQPVASVAVRRSWYPNGRDAYIGLGYKNTKGEMRPYVRWLDNSHLLIVFPEGAEDPITCKEHVSDIFVKCEVEKTGN